MNDNQEMFEELMKYKDIIDKQNMNLNNIQDTNINDVQYENFMLKKQLSDLILKENKKDNKLNENEFEIKFDKKKDNNFHIEHH